MRSARPRHLAPAERPRAGTTAATRSGLDPLHGHGLCGHLVPELIHVDPRVIRFSSTSRCQAGWRRTQSRRCTCVRRWRCALATLPPAPPAPARWLSPPPICAPASSAAPAAPGSRSRPASGLSDDAAAGGYGDAGFMPSPIQPGMMRSGTASSRGSFGCRGRSGQRGGTKPSAGAESSTLFLPGRGGWVRSAGRSA